MNSENFYDQLASDDVVSQAKFQQEMKQIQTRLDKDLGGNLQESSGLVNPLGLQGESLYNQKGGLVAQAPPNFGHRNQLDLNKDDYNTAGGASEHPSARNPRESADLTIDMLTGKGNNLALRKQLSDQSAASNMPRNPDNNAFSQQVGQIEENAFSIEQFRQNNAQLQQIMMQLQGPTASDFGGQPAQVPPSYGAPTANSNPNNNNNNNFNSGQQLQQQRSDQFKQLSSAPTGHTDTNPSSKHTATMGENPAPISQFSYKDEELPSTSLPVSRQQSQQQHQYAASLHQQQYGSNGGYSSAQMQQQLHAQQHQHDPSGQQHHHLLQQQRPQVYSQQQDYRNGGKADMLPPQANIATQQPTRSTSPIGTNGQHPQQNYRQVFKPNNVGATGTLQAAGHSIMDSKENFNGGANQQLQQQVSQVELLSQLQQSSLHQSSIYQQQQSSRLGNYQSNNPQPMQMQPQQQQTLSQQASQPSLAGEFTLQPRQPGQAPQASIDVNKQPKQQVGTDPTSFQVAAQHKQILQHFDDIPIQQIQKMPGYQTGMELPYDPAAADLQASQVNANGGVIGSLEDEDAQSRPIEERAQNSKWKIRLAAYKEINTMFYNDYAQFEESKNTAGTAPNGNAELMASFDQYGPLLQKMIMDSNTINAYEGLQVMHTYAQFALDIKSVTFASHNYILEKAPTNKTNVRDICLKIVLLMLRRDQSAMMYPELTKRIKSSQPRIASFAMLVICEALQSATALYDLNMKMVYRTIQDSLSQKNKELRDLAMQILIQVYTRCADDTTAFLAHCPGLRPVQAKEIKEVLVKQNKVTPKQGHLIKLFESGEDGGEISANAKEAKDMEAGSRHASAAASAFEAPSRDTNQAQAQAAEQIDLLTLIPDNFQEIPYITQINIKRKSMESFNGELAKLSNGRRPGSLPVKNKDYTLIYNTVAHMLEDKNMLVFVEAIKSVELLCCLIGPLNYLKQPKVKTWINLLAGKYGETKTAVIAALDKAMQAVVKHAYNQVMFSTECVNHICQTHKNPRVKQFVIEHTILPFIKSIEKEKDLLGNIFRSIKDKLVQMILKDNSASCRDAAVTLLVTFKQLIPSNSLMEAAITALPKYRVSEINKRLEESTAAAAAQGFEDEGNMQAAAQTMALPTKSSQQALGAAGVQEQRNQLSREAESENGASEQQKPKFAKSLTQRIKSAKGETVSGPSQNTQQQPQMNFVDEVLKGKFLTQETKTPLTEIVYDLGMMKNNQFEQLYASQEMEQKWDKALRQIGEMGLRECKPILVNAIHSVITTPKVELFDNQQYLKSMLGLVKRLFVLERSIERQDDGKSFELEQFLKVALLQNVWIGNNQGETCQMLQVAMVATGNAFEFTEHLREVIEQPMILQCPAALQIIEAAYVWLGIRLNDFLAAGMELSDLEMLRGFGIKYLDGAGFNESQRQALISIMIKFKELVQFKREELEQSEVPTRPVEGDKELPSVSQMSRQQTPQIDNEPPGESDARLQSSQCTQPQTAKFAAESLMQESMGLQASQIENSTPRSSDELSSENICRLIDTEFEKGLLLFKEMAQQQTLDFEIKETIFCKLLSIVSEGYRANQQQQYKQAYALKALMWMKEETLGIEDCFRLTQKVMAVFAKSEMQELDSTVELYLLNFWTKDLSIRDLADRIGLCVLNAEGDQGYQTGYSVSLTAQKCSSSQICIFNSLLNWFSDKRLFKLEDAGEEAEEEDDWLISDLRKIILYITLSTLDRQLPSSGVTREFLKKSVKKFGLEKVKEFMEIQLMHHNELSLKLLDWLDSEFENRIRTESQGNLANGVSISQMENSSKKEETETRVKLPSMPKVNLEEVISAKHNTDSSLYSAGESSSKQGTSQSSRQTPRGMVGASQSYKERRDLYKMKSSGKARESSVGAVQQQEETAATSNYCDIINRIEQNLGSNEEQKSAADRCIDEASGESDERASQQEEVEEESKERQYTAGATAGAADDQPFRTTNSSAYYRSIEKKRKRYTPSAEELGDDQYIKGDDSSSDETVTELSQRSQQKKKQESTPPPLDEQVRRPNAPIQPTLQTTQPSNMTKVNQIEDQLQLSTMKEKHINDKIQMLELEKMRIEQQSEHLQQQKDQESAEWKTKVAQMENEHAKVIGNLKNVNSQYSQQCDENESLRSQLTIMQEQHTQMMSRFDQIEKKLEQDRQKALSPVTRVPNSAVRESTAKKDMIVSVQKIQRIEETFGQAMLSDGTQCEIEEMISKIQRLLLGVEQNVEGELAQPLIIHYTKLKLQSERMQMISALDKALESNEDVLVALSSSVYKALLNYLLWAFAHEKQIIETASVSNIRAQADQNQVTVLSQQLVSKLLNSKRFTTSLVALFQLLREGMPTDIAAELSIESRQYLRVIMRCIKRITGALHSEQTDLVRAFDVLVEMHKLFQKNPPELLREDLPCLDDLDAIYKGMKDVTDKLIELQPEKVESFLNYAVSAESDQQNAFIRYLMQVMGSPQ